MIEYKNLWEWFYDIINSDLFLKKIFWMLKNKKLNEYSEHMKKHTYIILMKIWMYFISINLIYYLISIYSWNFFRESILKVKTKNLYTKISAEVFIKFALDKEKWKYQIWCDKEKIVLLHILFYLKQTSTICNLINKSQIFVNHQFLLLFLKVFGLLVSQYSICTERYPMNILTFCTII